MFTSILLAVLAFVLLLGIHALQHHSVAEIFSAIRSIRNRGGETDANATWFTPTTPSPPTSEEQALDAFPALDDSELAQPWLWDWTF